MRRIEIEAFEDRTRPDGGHAVIVLHGVGRLPSDLVFRLQPVEFSALDGAAPSWLGHDQRPEAMLATPDGPALVIGPEITDSPLLVAGSLVEIVLPQAGIRGEFLWPTIAPHGPTRRRTLLFKAGRKQNIVMQAPAMPADGRAHDLSTHLTATAAMPSATAAVVSNAMFQQSISPVTTVPVTAPASRALSTTADRGMEALIVPRQPLVDFEQADPDPPPDTAAVAPTPAAPSLSPAMIAAAAVMALLAVQTFGMAMLDLQIVAGKELSAVQSPSRTVEASAAPVKVVHDPSAIYDLLATNAVSPRGVGARGVSPAKALEHAQANLRGTDGRGKDGSRDPEEAAFWLKRYVATTFGAEMARIALTQLGSSYADSARQPADFGRARLAWELAGALGDPVALCFLGAVHAQGLGTPADRATASQWYARASTAGATCPTDR